MITLIKHEQGAQNIKLSNSIICAFHWIISTHFWCQEAVGGQRIIWQLVVLLIKKTDAGKFSQVSLTAVYILSMLSLINLTRTLQCGLDFCLQISSECNLGRSNSRRLLGIKVTLMQKHMY